MSDFARCLGSYPQDVQKLLDGRVGKSKWFAKIAQALGCSLEWLNTGTGKPPGWALPPITATAELVSEPTALYATGGLGAPMRVREEGPAFDPVPPPAEQGALAAILGKMSAAIDRLSDRLDALSPLQTAIDRLGERLDALPPLQELRGLPAELREVRASLTRLERRPATAAFTRRKAI